MKHARNIVALLILVALVGCSSNPTARWVTARKTLTVTERGLVTANQAGILSDKKFIDTEPAILGARAALDKAAKFLPEGGDIFTVLMSGADKWLNEMLLTYNQALKEADDPPETVIE